MWFGQCLAKRVDVFALGQQNQQRTGNPTQDVVKLRLGLGVDDQRPATGTLQHRPRPSRRERAIQRHVTVARQEGAEYARKGCRGPVSEDRRQRRAAGGGSLPNR